MTEVPPSEDQRHRRSADGRFWCRCAFCGDFFLNKNRHVQVCGATLDPPEAWCARCVWPSRTPTRKKRRSQYA